VGNPCRLVARLVNHGGKRARGVKAALTVPPGVRVCPLAPGGAAPLNFEFQVPAAFRFVLTADRPVRGEAVLRLSAPNIAPATYRAPIAIERALDVPKADYVPEPRPARTRYQVGTYYFPGWDTGLKWECIENIAPIRKPVLGYYDESNPEVADWQIKWAVEHGITFFLVDWYWSAGNRHLEHWLHNAYLRSRYRRHLQWAVMWANHNAPNTHSEEDWRQVTQYWIDHYFGMPEYQRLNGKPAVYIWAPSNIRRDVGGTQNAARLLAMSQEMAKKAGYPGISFVSMNAGGSPEEARLLAAEGYVANTTYHWWADAPSIAPDPQHFSYSLVVSRSRQAWEKRAKVGAEAGLPFIPVADTGWDSRPWHGDRARVISGRTVPEFERLLREAKAYLDDRGETMLILGPCNEWGEGSYIEPCAEFGFGMYDAVRRVFCDEPEPHTDLAPVDVGLGPYDLPMAAPAVRSEWHFNTPGDPE
ncbi:MAG: glycoside hydrolase family 99-like domain-containing protein, partial [Armatimonadota bacterium]|nr:glycoside hydrolase family 99-like domain-containing protein [Armatimonadota bacterium]